VAVHWADHGLCWFCHLKLATAKQVFVAINALMLGIGILGQWIYLHNTDVRGWLDKQR
jgi:hypothetical protein